jgi:hypothetical protein
MGAGKLCGSSVVLALCAASQFAPQSATAPGFARALESITLAMASCALLQNEESAIRCAFAVTSTESYMGKCVHDGFARRLCCQS